MYVLTMLVMYCVVTELTECEYVSMTRLSHMEHSQSHLRKQQEKYDAGYCSDSSDAPTLDPVDCPEQPVSYVHLNYVRM